MGGEKIFIVEDEKIVAEDLKRMLCRLGYDVSGSAANGEEAMKQMEMTPPQLVLMDIRIQGPLDGVEVAEQVVTQFDIPVIYLTAYADETTVERAKGTLPFGYIMKPFNEVGLKIKIDLALYRHKMDRMLKNVEEWHGGILKNLSAAVVALDLQGCVTYMNKTAEQLLGIPLEKCFGQPMETLFSIEEKKSDSGPSPLFIKRQGERVLLDSRRSPIRDLEDRVIGTALVLQKSPRQDAQT